MRILVETKGDLLSLLDQSPLRRRDIDVQPVSDARRAVEGRARSAPDLCLLPGDTDAATLAGLRRAGLQARRVSDAGDAASALMGVGIPTRRHERVPLHVPVRLEADGERLDGLTKDISLGGVFVRCLPGIAEGRVVSLRIGGRGGLVRLPARVVRRVEDEDDRLTGLGLDFGEMGPVERGALEELVQSPPPVPRLPGLRYRT
jgi:hypothetical protein